VAGKQGLRGGAPVARINADSRSRRGQILNGGDTAATDFFKSKTTDRLTAAFKPVIDRSMSQVGYGLFNVLGEQERQIRVNPAARTTDLLKEVFGKQ
jgi:hypothetical protein